MDAHYIPVYQSTGIVAGHELSAPPLINGAWQSIYEQSLTQNFPIGTRLQVHDRTFYYCKAASVGTAVAMKAGHADCVEVDVNTFAEVYPAGATEIRVEDTATRAANYWQNGYVWVMNLVSGVYQHLKIKSSEEAIAADDHVHLTLYDPLPFAIPASTFVALHQNPFSNVSFATSDYMAMVCVPLIPVTASYYFWGQTWGPCFGTAQSAIPGAASADREVYFGTDGALMAGVDVDALTVMRQRAGFILSNTTSGGDQFYMLQITP
jgi:hypothetical protein